jgi:hypothetical protein
MMAEEYKLYVDSHVLVFLPNVIKKYTLIIKRYY